LEDESNLYQDMVIGPFLDSYRNLTYKHVMALKWVHYHCPEARYVLKSDDDVFVHTPALQRLIANGTFHKENAITCGLNHK
jgi:hypothetical protein